MPDPTLRSFSDYLLALSALARRADPDRFLPEALERLRPLVPFRSAWWGETSPGDATVPPHNWLHGTLSLPEGYAAEWCAIAREDSFAHDSMRCLGEVQRFSGHESDHDSVTRFSERYDLGQVMAITLEMPDSGLLFFVALYRGLGEPAFDDAQAAVFAECCRHLQQLWGFQMQAQLQRLSADNAREFALAGRDGRLLFVGERLLRLLAHHHPGWSGRFLPEPVLAQAAAGAGSLRLGTTRVALQAAGQHLILLQDHRSGSTELPPRVRAAALLYAQGSSYKEIARALQLTPATVRTYLRDTYLQLGVRNKVELGTALEQPRPRRG